MEIDNIINRVEKRIELAIMISIFFPSLMNAFFSSFDSNALEPIKQSSTWFILVGLYLFNYVLYQWLKKIKVPQSIYKFLGLSTLLNIALFIAPTIFLAMLVSGPITSSLSWLYFVSLKISIPGLPLMAFISFITICFGISYGIATGFRKKSDKKQF